MIGQFVRIHTTTSSLLGHVISMGSAKVYVREADGHPSGARWDRIKQIDFIPPDSTTYRNFEQNGIQHRKIAQLLELTENISTQIDQSVEQLRQIDPTMSASKLMEYLTKRAATKE